MANESMPTGHIEAKGVLSVETVSTLKGTKVYLATVSNDDKSTVFFSIEEIKIPNGTLVLAEGSRAKYGKNMSNRLTSIKALDGTSPKEESSKKSAYVSMPEDYAFTLSEEDKKNRIFPFVPKGYIAPMCIRVEDKTAIFYLYRYSTFDVKALNAMYGKDMWKMELGEQKVVNQNTTIMCTVSVYNQTLKEWVPKQAIAYAEIAAKDCEKALDTVAFKTVNSRALEIGKELYDIPPIEIPTEKLSITRDLAGVYKCESKLYVSEIDYDKTSRLIVHLVLNRMDTCEKVYEFNREEQ